MYSRAKNQYAAVSSFPPAATSPHSLINITSDNNANKGQYNAVMSFRYRTFNEKLS